MAPIEGAESAALETADAHLSVGQSCSRIGHAAFELQAVLLASAAILIALWMHIA